MAYIKDLIEDLTNALRFGWRVGVSDFFINRHMRRGENPDNVPF